MGRKASPRFADTIYAFTTPSRHLPHPLFRIENEPNSSGLPEFPQTYPETEVSWYREKKLVRVGALPAQVFFQFHRHARPQIVLTAPTLDCRKLDVQSVRGKPCYWDLPASEQAGLLHMQLRLGEKAYTQARLPTRSFTAAIHIGRWVRSSHIHSDILLGVAPYFTLLSSALAAIGRPLAENDAALPS